VSGWKEIVERALKEDASPDEIVAAQEALEALDLSTVQSLGDFGFISEAGHRLARRAAEMAERFNNKGGGEL
jgi:hypothetical protein